MYGRQEPSQGICRFSWHYQIPVLKETELAQNTAYRLYDDPTYIPGALVLNKICTTYQDKGVQPETCWHLCLTTN